jgi:hypothetical protein
MPPRSKEIIAILPENTEQGLHACDTAADRSLTPEQNWQWDEFLARNKIQLEHNKLQQLEELLLYNTQYTKLEPTPPNSSSEFKYPMNPST